MCLCSLSPGPRGRLVCFYVVCLLVYPEKGPRGRLICLHVVCPLVHPEKGPRGRLVCPLCSLSPGTGVPGEGFFCLHVACLLVFLKRLQGKAFQWVLLHCMGQVNAQELHPSYTYHNFPLHLLSLYTRTPPLHPIYFHCKSIYLPPPIFSYFNNSLLRDCCIPHPLVHYYVLILYCVS